jgi:hypothetical protein
MKKSVLLSFVALLALGAGAQAADLSVAAEGGIVSVSMTQVTISSPCLIPTLGSQLCLIQAPICNPCPVVPLIPSPHLIPSPCFGLLGSPCIQPNATLLVLEMRAGMAPCMHDSALAILMNLR